MQVQFARPAVALVTDRRAASRTEAAAHAGRGAVIGGLALREAYLGPLEAGIGADRRAGVAPAALAVAVAGPLGWTLGGEADGAAQTSSRALSMEHAPR